MFPDGLGWTIVDALDTMMIMNLTRELSHAREWVSTTLHYDQDHDVNQFEITIRMIGGLLSAHYLQQELGNSGVDASEESSVLKDDDLWLEKAVDLADRVLGSYESKTGIPYASVNLATRQGLPSRDDDGASSTSEAATVQLEMKYLAQLTGEKNYWDKAERIMKVIDDNGVRDGLVPIFIYADKGTFHGENIRLGSRGDSYYEYLIKQYLQTSNQEPVYKDMWDQAWAGVKKHLITYTKHANLTILAERPDGLDKPLFAKMDHLVCFMPGTIVLATTEGLPIEEARAKPSWGKQQEDDIELARQLMTTCWGMYKTTATGLSPEIAHFKIHNPPIMMDQDHPHPVDPFVDTESTNWHMDYEIHRADFHNLQRPETVESLFYMWRLLGDETYRHWGWEMFESFMEHTRVKDGGGFSSVNDVDKIPPPLRDNMESFWLVRSLSLFPISRPCLRTDANDVPLRRPKRSNTCTSSSAPTTCCRSTASSSTPRRTRCPSSSWASSSRRAGRASRATRTGTSPARRRAARGRRRARRGSGGRGGTGWERGGRSAMAHVPTDVWRERRHTPDTENDNARATYCCDCCDESPRPRERPGGNKAWESRAAAGHASLGPLISWRRCIAPLRVACRGPPYHLPLPHGSELADNNATASRRPLDQARRSSRPRSAPWPTVRGAQRPRVRCPRFSHRQTSYAGAHVCHVGWSGSGAVDTRPGLWVWRTRATGGRRAEGGFTRAPEEMGKETT